MHCCRWKPSRPDIFTLGSDWVGLRDKSGRLILPVLFISQSLHPRRVQQSHALIRLSHLGHNEQKTETMDASCHCGAVNFKTPTPKPLALYICHCHDCQRQTSSAFGMSAIFPTFQLPDAELLSCYT